MALYATFPCAACTSVGVATRSEQQHPHHQHQHQHAAPRRLRRVDPPLLHVVPSSKRFLVNVGLPRTGTTSFQMACESIGLRTVHSWNPPGRTKPEHYRDHWYREHYAKVLTGTPGPALENEEALTDSPFYSRAADFKRAYPNSTFVCTTRSVNSWVDSMMYGHLLAGGLYLPRLYGLAAPYRNTSETRHNLTRLFREHARDECAAVNATNLDLRDGAVELWRRLCLAMPSEERREACERRRASHPPWPRTHTEVSAGKKTVHRRD